MSQVRHHGIRTRKTGTRLHIHSKDTQPRTTITPHHHGGGGRGGREKEGRKEELCWVFVVPWG